MEEKIELALLDKFRDDYNKIKNEKLQKALQTRPILDVCLNEEIKAENKFEFNIELEDCKIYNQYSSKRCWMFAVLNLIKNNMAQNLNQSVMTFELSTNYLNFYDKLEKANHAYQTIIDLKVSDDFVMCDYDSHPLLTGYLKDPVRENGKLNFASALLKKYGIVPMSVMPETFNSRYSEDFNNWFTRKIRYDMQELLSLKGKKKNLYKAKKRMLKECYNLLANILGEPPKTINYNYIDKNNDKKNILNFTPIEFYNQYCSINLDNFVQIAQMPIFDYYKKYERRYSKNLVEAEAHNFINVPQNEFTSLCLSQLKEGIPVVIGCDNRKYRDKESKILDTRIFDFEKLLGIKDLEKLEALKTFDCKTRHFMTIRGAFVENDKPLRWKVEDTAGDEARINGFYVMNNNYFEKCVYYAWIDKKFLSKKITNLLETKAELYGFEGSEL